MEYSLTFAAAVAVVVAICALAVMIGEIVRPVLPLAAAPAPTIARLAEPCRRDGVLITSMDRLRIAVTMADTMIVRGGLNGQRINMATIRDDADAFARAQSSPSVTLAMLERCDETLLQQYAHGYWLINSALVRESARRNGFIPTSAQ